MKVQFIAQGIPESIGTPAGDVINNALLTTNYNSFAAFVAFVSVDGINQLKESFKQFIDSGGQIRLYVGVDLHGTSKEALELLLSLDNVKTYIVYSSNRIIYHPKIYSFEGDNNNMVMVGSSNLTLSGLYQNIEASLCITNEGEDEQDKSLISDIYDYYNAILSNDSTYCQPLSQEIIDLLCENKIVLTSKESRVQFNEQSKQNKTSVSEREKLKDKIELLKVDVTPDRFEQEVALLAQKSDIAEEYDRIKSHIKETRNILKKGGICGKRLDFMMQEFNREANTMASKASNLNITRVAVDLKVLIEQMREQIQNIE